jgi:hypothetical protein
MGCWRDIRFFAARAAAIRRVAQGEIVMAAESGSARLCALRYFGLWRRQPTDLYSNPWQFDARGGLQVRRGSNFRREQFTQNAYNTPFPRKRGTVILKGQASLVAREEGDIVLNAVLQELRGEVDRSTLQCVVVENPKARYIIPPQIVEEVLKHLLGEFLIGLLGLGILHGLGQRLHRAGADLRNWVTSGNEPVPAAKSEIDAALEEALAAARAHARTEAGLLAASKRVEELMHGAGASPSETRDVVDAIQRVLGRCWTK